MLMMLFILNWILSIMFIFMKHPLSLGCILLLQTILISLSSGFMYFNFWFSYMIFLIMLGGMLVMFMYMTGVASNEKFSLPQNMIIFLMSMFFLFMILLIYSDKFYSNSILLNSSSKSQSILILNNTLSKFLNSPNMIFMTTLIMYLLLCLIAVVKISINKLGTLRKK